MGGNAQSDDVKQRLLACGRREFIQKGFSGASLRSICSAAGVTTGALYFFFKDKDDLFCSIFGGLFDRIQAILDSHFGRGAELADDGSLLTDDFTDDYMMGEMLIDALYDCREDVITLLSGAEGSSLANIKDALIEKIDAHNHMLAEGICRELQIPMVSGYLVHWMSHTQLDMFEFLIEHIEDKADAKEYMKGAMAFELAGWQAVFGMKAG